jgi:fluoride ion exporter CrcB/FEX
LSRFGSGVTTLSAFAFENVELLLDRNYSTFAAYSTASLILCLASAYLGLIVSRS